jgi:hypothetical protein
VLAAVLAVLGVAGWAVPAGAATAPGFSNYAAPAPLGQDAGEPSIGINWKSGNVLYQAGLQTLKVRALGAEPTRPPARSGEFQRR